MTLDPRTPVVVGVGQVVQRGEPADAVETVALMTQAVEQAVADSGAAGLGAGATAVRAVNGAWRYPDPARIVAERIGAPDATTGLSTDGGNTPQYLVNRTCNDLLAGRHETVVLVGCETIYSRRRARTAGVKVPTTIQEGVEPDEILGADVTMSSEHEKARGLEMPINFYPLFESAIRASRGETIDEHRDRIAKLWEGFNRVAVENPYAWRREPMTWQEIREATPDNRMVGFPYTKAMNSNWDLDQAAAVVLTTVEAAERLGIACDRWVFPVVGTDAMDTANVTNRSDLHSSPAIRHAGARAFELAGVGPDDLAHVDLYSCFPSAVQIGATELGLGQERQLTVTGGLTFAGGPLNNYVMHSIATMIGLLREDAGSTGMCTANGGYVTKHAIGLYSTTPPEDGFRHEDVQARVDAEPTTAAADDHVGTGTIEAYTVMHGRDGAEVGLVAIATPDGRRAWGNTRDGELLAEMCRTEHIGRGVELDSEGVVRLT